MSASNQTVKAVLDVVGRHVRKKTLRRIVRDLLEVPGNASFRETIQRMAATLDETETAE